MNDIQCQECGKNFKGTECSCGWKISQDISKFDRDCLKAEHQNCFFEIHGKRCKMLGTMSCGSSGSYRKDSSGKPVSGPWYCLWHFEILTGTKNEITTFGNFVTECQKHSTNQFSARKLETLWSWVGGYG